MSQAPDPRETTADALRAAAETMHAVRDHCVWTQQITHRDLVPYLVEESAELIDAVEEGSRADLREELGDLLWQVLFHAEIASRDPDDPFDIDDVAAGLTDKMVRRHPHVFAGETAETPAEVLVHWNAAKALEKHERTSVLDGVSERMPSLALAHKLLSKAAQVGLEPAATARLQSPDEDAGAARGLGGQMQSRGSEVAEPASESELGDALLELVATARAQGWDAERALRERLRALRDSIRSAEQGQ
ncbi:MazG family protein [Microbacterium fluvii]|uniref:MazG family protein n=1 Tax=Microbacterium fluvii TaxID=415215 RepID=A0ABW2HBM2_9MICO|nr:MazG family protein [Microbacterium fluvii]MCU4672356.1 MazG family protein [Microbacterium fluvii]